MGKKIHIQHIILKIALVLLLLAPLSPSNPQSSSFIDMIPTFLLMLLYTEIYKRKITAGYDILSVIAMYVMVFVNTAITSLITPNAAEFSMRVFVTFAAFIIYYIMLISVEKKIDIMPFILNMYKLIALIASITIIVGGLLGYTYSWGRFSLDIIGIHKNPNYVTGFILGAFALNTYEFIILNLNNKKMLRLISLVCMPVAFVFSGTRAAILGAVIIAFLVVFSKLKAGKSSLRNAGIIIITFVVCFLVLDNIIEFIPANYLNRITFFNENYTEDSRVLIWSSILKSFFNGNIITGFGMYGAERFSNTMFGLSTHNIMLEALFDWGILGFCLFLMTLFYEFKKINKNDRREVLVFMFGLYWPTFFQNGLYALNFWFPLIMSRLMIEHKINKMHEETGNNSIGGAGGC